MSAPATNLPPTEQHSVLTSAVNITLFLVGVGILNSVLGDGPRAGQGTMLATILSTVVDLAPFVLIFPAFFFAGSMNTRAAAITVGLYVALVTVVYALAHQTGFATPASSNDLECHAALLLLAFIQCTSVVAGTHIDRRFR